MGNKSVNKFEGTNEIFVFGSNIPGRHGKGAALFALENYGAVYGVGNGRTGNAYAIPTKDGDHFKGGKLWVLPLSEIKKYVNEFINYANEHSELIFKVVKIGQGLSGYRTEDMAPMFATCPDNCILPDEWMDYYLKVDFHD